jgi:hypothetical protein
MNDFHTETESHPGRKGRVIPSRVDRDLVAPAGEGFGEGGNVNVLAARIDTAQGGERAGVF